MEAATRPATKPVSGANASASATVNAGMNANASANMTTGASGAMNANGCGNGNGSLPCPCALLAFPYIPMQENDPPRYSQDDAMRAGTLFPGLNLPFHKEIRSRFPAANTALSELMALDFAIQELGLYLTTHADDSEVLELYWSYVRMGRQGRERYVEQYGPLSETDITPGSFKWLNDPWPWDLGGND